MAGVLKYPKGELNVLEALDRKLAAINEEGVEIILPDKPEGAEEVVDKDTFEPPKDLQPKYTKVPKRSKKKSTNIQKILFGNRQNTNKHFS